MTPRAVLRRRRVLGALTVTGALLAVTQPVTAGAHPKPPKPVDLQILSFNDYHGHLQPPDRLGRPRHDGARDDRARRRRRVPDDAPAPAPRRAPELADGGGRATSSAARRSCPASSRTSRASRRSTRSGWTSRRSATTSSTRASPSCCACSTAAATRPRAASTPTATRGAKFDWLAANVTYKDGVPTPRVPGHPEYGWWGHVASTGRTVLPPSDIKLVQGVPVGFIGMTLEGTPELVAQAGIRDVEFKDEVATANLAAARPAQARREVDRRAAARGRPAAVRRGVRLPVHDRRRRSLRADHRHREEPRPEHRPRRHRAHAPGRTPATSRTRPARPAG